jgi:hypothetical protein
MANKRGTESSKRWPSQWGQVTPCAANIEEEEPWDAYDQFSKSGV